MAKGDEPAKVPVIAIILALIWLIFLAVVCLGTLVTIWPHPTPAGTPPATSTSPSNGTAPPTSTQPATTTGGTTSTASGKTQPEPLPCANDKKLADECDCLQRVKIMQGIYYGPGDKSPLVRSDPSCVYIWMPFNLFGLSGWHVLWGETRLLLIVMLCGFLGAMIYSLRSFFWYTGNRELVWSWMAMYILVPVVGAMMAVVFYLVFRGGLFSPTTTVSETSPFGFAAIAALVGMFIQQSAMKLKDIFETLMTKAEQGKDTAPPSTTPPAADAAKPAIDVTPAAAPHGAAATLTIKGENFTNTSKVFAGTTVLTTTFVSADQLTADLPATAIPSAGSKADITVQTGSVTTKAFTITAT